MHDVELMILRDRFSRAGLEDFDDSLAALVRPAILPTVTGEVEQKLPLGISKLGGIADLPLDQRWPEYRGFPLNFLAQIALKDIHHLEAATPLPSRGLLSFFYGVGLEAWGYDTEDKGAWAVLWSPEVGELKPRATPNPIESPDPYPGMRFSFEEALSLPDQFSPCFEALELSQEEEEIYCEVYSESLPPQMFRLMGHPFTGQSVSEADPPLVIGASTSGRRGEKELGSESKPLLEDEWRLLLALPYSDETGIVYGHSGILHFFIRIGDLQERRFEEAWLVVESW